MLPIAQKPENGDNFFSANIFFLLDVLFYCLFLLVTTKYSEKITSN